MRDAIRADLAVIALAGWRMPVGLMEYCGRRKIPILILLEPACPWEWEWVSDSELDQYREACRAAE